MNDLTEIIYRLDERLKSLDQNVTEIKADIQEMKRDFNTAARQVAVNTESIAEIKDKLKSARTVSWTAIATAVVGALNSFFKGGGA